jgi:hypothetical protein
MEFMRPTAHTNQFKIREFADLPIDIHYPLRSPIHLHSHDSEITRFLTVIGHQAYEKPKGCHARPFFSLFRAIHYP